MTGTQTSIGVVVPAAGKGIRLGGERPKQLLELAGKPLFVHALEYFQRSPLVDAIILVTLADLIPEIKVLVGSWNLSKVLDIVEGGKERQDSVWRGLVRFAPFAPEYVLIHDAVRPFPDDGIIERVLGAAAQFGAAVPAISPKETIKISAPGLFVASTPMRDGLWAIQTPQAFRFSLIYRAYEKARSEQYYATDDASLVERMGEKVKIVEGNYENIKITTQEDQDLALAIYNRRNRR